jgi:hypothetical protein
VNDDDDSPEGKLPVLAGNHLPSAEVKIHFTNFKRTKKSSCEITWMSSCAEMADLTVLALAFLSTLVFTLASTKIYEASAVIEVNQETPQVTKFEEVLASKVQAREFYETQVELICSRAMINRVIDKLDLTNHPVIVETLFGDGRFNLGRRIREIFKSFMPSIEEGEKRFGGFRGFRKAPKSGRVHISENLSATPSRKSMLIDVNFARRTVSCPYGRQHAR